MLKNVTAPTTPDVIDSLLSLIQRVGEQLGRWVVNFFEKILGSGLPKELEASVGILILLTLFLAAAEFSRKILWYVVAVGWFLVALRISMEVLSLG